MTPNNFEPILSICKVDKLKERVNMKRINFNKNKINQCLPNLMGVNTNLNTGPWSDSASRLYMEGNMVPKSVVVSGASERLIIAGFEKQYGENARSIIAPSDMTVEEVFIVKSNHGDGLLADGWKEIFVVFKNEDKNYYDILVMPRFNTQNTYIGFEYVYDKDMIRRLREPNATFGKGEVFAKSPRISPTGEWMFGVETIVAPYSWHPTEEDGIVISDRYAREKLRCMFKHERGFEYNEDEWIPLNLYGTIEDPQPFGQPGEKIRDDGIVMGFRRRNGSNPLISLTKKGLMRPDYAYDKLFYAPPNSVLMDVKIEAEILKNRSHNRNTEQIKQSHNAALKEYESMQNNFYIEIINWYEKLIVKHSNQEPEASYELDRFIRNAYSFYTKRNGQTNTLKYSYKNIKHKDWKIKILLKEEVEGKVKFKMSGLNGDKGVVVKVKPWQEMPHYADGTYADVCINNTPVFRRQIITMLNEATINFINLSLHREIKSLHAQGKWLEAWERLDLFYTSGFPEFAELVHYGYETEAERKELIDWIVANEITVQIRSDTEVYGVNIIRQLRKHFKYQPQKMLFTNEFGIEVESHYPIMITSMYFMLLDKFGSDDSSQAFPKANPFGLPTSNSQADKHTNWFINKGSRTTGEAESRWMNSQKGPKETVKQLAIANSEVVRNNVVKRLLRAEDPFDIDMIVKDEEIETNRALIMGADMLSDSGYILRHERPEDRDQTND